MWQFSYSARSLFSLFHGYHQDNIGKYLSYFVIFNITYYCENGGLNFSNLSFSVCSVVYFAHRFLCGLSSFLFLFFSSSRILLNGFSVTVDKPERFLPAHSELFYSKCSYCKAQKMCLHFPMA